MSNPSPFDARFYSQMMPSSSGLTASCSGQKQQLWDWEANPTEASKIMSAHPSIFASGGSSNLFYDSAVTVPSASMAAAGSACGGADYPFYPGTAVEYHPTQGLMIRREENHPGEQFIGLDLGHRVYFPMVRRRMEARCQVEGCNADLSAAKQYHRRHKVCEYHSKAAMAVAGGLLQRFCQQCSRFHALSEFDETKRSCRKRLADHNLRRRKPDQPPAANDRTASTAKKTSSRKPIKSTETAKDVGTNSTTAILLGKTKETHRGSFALSTQIPKAVVLSDENNRTLQQQHRTASLLPIQLPSLQLQRRRLTASGGDQFDRASEQSINLQQHVQSILWN